MKNSKKLILVMVSIICIVILLVGSIAYYRIVVNGSIKGSTGNAVFVLRDSDNSVWNNKVIDLGKINPGDSGEFTVTMDASGSSVDMYATLEIERTNLPTNLKFYTTSDHKSELHKYYSFLETTNQTETLTIYWYWNPYISDEEDSKFINVSNLEANIRVSAVQISEYAMMKNGASNSTEFWSYSLRNVVRIINFGNDLSNLPSSCTGDADLCWDVSYSTTQDKKVYAYMIDSGIQGVTGQKDNSNEKIYENLYNLYIVSEAPIFAPQDCSNMFYSFINLVTINFNDNFNTSLTTNMQSMFQAGFYTYKREAGVATAYIPYEKNNMELLDNNVVINPTLMDYITLSKSQTNLENLNLSSFNTSKVTDMSNMFDGCNALTSLELGSFNTSNVTDMYSMFSGCSSLTSLNLSSFDTSRVTDMMQIFFGCSSLTILDLSSFDTSNVTDMSRMFYHCSSLTSLDLSSFNTSNVTGMGSMFEDCSSLTNLDLSSFDTSKVTNMYGMFSWCSSLTNLDLSSFNTSNVTYMSDMFYNCYKLQTAINIMNADTTNYSDMFGNALSDNNAYVILGYTSNTQSIAEAMKETAPTANQSKITLKQI